MFTLRFDMRAPVWGAPIEDLYAAAIEMSAWAEGRGALVAVLSEHHGAQDRHLPSPLILASAIAARTVGSEAEVSKRGGSGSALALAISGWALSRISRSSSCSASAAPTRPA